MRTRFVLLSLVLVTLSFRENGDGPVGGAQSAAGAVLRPFQVAADRVAKPFRDAYGWTSSLLDARSDAARLEKENELLRQQARQRLAIEPVAVEAVIDQRAQLLRRLPQRRVVEEQPRRQRPDGGRDVPKRERWVTSGWFGAWHVRGEPFGC